MTYREGKAQGARGSDSAMGSLVLPSESSVTAFITFHPLQVPIHKYVLQGKKKKEKKKKRRKKQKDYAHWRGMTSLVRQLTWLESCTSGYRRPFRKDQTEMQWGRFVLCAMGGWVMSYEQWLKDRPVWGERLRQTPATSLSGDQEQDVTQTSFRQLVSILSVVDSGIHRRHKHYRELLDCIEGSFLMQVIKGLSKKILCWTC